MKITYDPKYDALYIYLSNQSIKITNPINPCTNLDFAANGELVGIEVLSASHVMGFNKANFTVEVDKNIKIKQ